MYPATATRLPAGAVYACPWPSAGPVLEILIHRAQYVCPWLAMRFPVAVGLLAFARALGRASESAPDHRGWLWHLPLLAVWVGPGTAPPASPVIGRRARLLVFLSLREEHLAFQVNALPGVRRQERHRAVDHHLVARYRRAGPEKPPDDRLAGRLFFPVSLHRGVRHRRANRRPACPVIGRPAVHLGARRRVRLAVHRQDAVPLAGRLFFPVSLHRGVRHRRANRRPACPVIGRPAVHLGARRRVRLAVHRQDAVPLAGRLFFPVSLHRGVRHRRANRRPACPVIGRPAVHLGARRRVRLVGPLPDAVPEVRLSA